MAFSISKPVLTVQVTNFRILQHSKTHFICSLNMQYYVKPRLFLSEFVENSQESSIILDCMVLS